MTTPLIRVAGLTKSFGGTKVVDDVSFEVAAGSVTAIIGPSGSGKSTILRALNSLEIAEAGVVSIGDFSLDYSSGATQADIKALRAHSGMVFQGNHLFGNLTAIENVALGPIVAQRRDKAEARSDAAELLKQLGLGDKLDARVQQLSGGQQQRVGIARALALKPDVLLFDEPTSALDPELIGEVLAAIRELAKDGWTMVLVTHEMRFAEQVADQVLFIDQGRIIERGTASEVLKSPREARTKQFLARILDH